MYQMMIEKYAKKGWLKHGMKAFSSDDRLWAAKRLRRDYLNSRGKSVGVINPLDPKVDGGRTDFGLMGNLEAKEAYIKAFGALPLCWRKMIEKVVLRDETLEILKLGYIKNLKEAKKQLSMALDCLILHYLSRDAEEEKNEKCFR